MNCNDTTLRDVRRYMAAGLSAVGLMILASSAAAIPPDIDPPTVNFWRDACESEAVMPETPEIERVIDATAFIVDPTLVTQNITRDTYSIKSSKFTSFDGYNFTESSLFYNEPVIYFEPGHPGRSAFLVSPDSVVTAPHTNDWDLTGYYVLFDYESVPDGLGNCIPPDLSQYPASKTRRITGYFNGYGTAAGDHLVAYLDSPMLDRSFVRVRRDGHAEVGDHVTIVGHPARLAKKFDTNAFVTAMSDDVPLVKPVHFIRFNSGSPLYNLTRQYVEMAVAYGSSCAIYVCAEPLVGSLCQSGEWNLVSQCPQSPTNVNSSIKPLAPEIESIALEVSPLSLNNIGTALGGFESPVTRYTLTSPAGPYSAKWIEYEIEPPVNGAGEPMLSIISPTPLTGTLPAGESLSFDVAASMPSSQPCGVYPREFQVHDHTNGFTDQVRQTLEVGQTAYTVDSDPENGNLIELEGIQQPYSATYMLTIRNIRPTAAIVRIRSTEPWLRINGDEGSPSALPQSVITIPGRQAASIAIGLSQASISLPLHAIHNAQVVIESADDTCNLTAPVTRRVRFSPGTLTVRQIVGASVPDASTTGVPGSLTSTLTVGEAFCVDQVKASYVFNHPPLEYPVATWLTESRWRINRPGSRRWITAWEQNVLPTCDPRDPDNPTAPCYLKDAGKRECLFDQTQNSECQILSVGDEPRPPLAECLPGVSDCEPFENLVGEAGQGAWTIRIEDRVHGGAASQPAISGWSLEFRGSPSCGAGN